MNSSWELARTQTRVTSDQDCSLLRHVHWLVCMLSGPVALVYTRLMKTHLPTLPCNREVLMGLWSQTTLEQVCTYCTKCCLLVLEVKRLPVLEIPERFFFFLFWCLMNCFWAQTKTQKKERKPKQRRKGEKKGSSVLWEHGVYDPPHPPPPKKMYWLKCWKYNIKPTHLDRALFV